MKRALILTLPLALVAACQRALDTAPTPVEQVAATAPVSDAVVAAPTGPLSAVDLRRVCRAGLAAIHGQQVSAIELTGLEGQVVNAEWRAPVDGGRMKAQCRAGDGLVVWKPLDLPDPESVRWMDRADDAVVRYVIRGEEIEITQTLPDGTTQQAMMPVRAEEEVS